MRRNSRKLPDEELIELERILISIRDSIDDSQQNLKDCLNTLRGLEKNLYLPSTRRTFFQRLLSLFSNK